MEDAKAVVLTGATGFLGGHLLAGFLRKDRPVVVLGRPSGDASLSERIDKMLGWFGLGDKRGLVRTLEADLTVDGFALPNETYGALCGLGGPIVHCASDTRFSERKRQEITEANLGGLTGVLTFAQEAKAPWFHYVSTAYAVGTGLKVCKEEIGNPTSFANVYEETKALAERRVADGCGREGVPFTILRPSIVFGDSVSGRSTAFQALYHHVRSLLAIRDIYLEDIRETGGARSKGFGIGPDGSGGLLLPLKVYLSERGSINLIPVDHFVTATLRILEDPQDGGVYHLTSDESRSMEDLAAYCERYLKVRGIEIVHGDVPEGALRNPAEELFNRFIGPYRSYLSDPRTFERTRTDRATGGLPVPVLTYDVFERCMDYAVEVGWKMGF